MQHLETRLGLPEAYRRRAAEICYQAFRQKLEPILGPPEQGVGVLERDLDPRSIVAALSGERLVGMLGLKGGGRRFFKHRISTLAREHGWLWGLLRWPLLLPVAGRWRAGHLKVGVVAVDAPLRGQGIGTRLLRFALDVAREEGFASVCLDVVDTNARARRLYERLGFVAVVTHSYPVLRRSFGFSAVTTMVKRIA